MKSLTRWKRADDELRPLSVTENFCTAACGSVLYQAGETMVICAVSASEKVPDHARERGWGWITAEYTMLPYSTDPRIPRRTDRPDGRSVEIQRLIGRALRSVVDMSLIDGVLFNIDCDVLRADGGTRTASINGGYLALKHAVRSLIAAGRIRKDPFTAQAAAVSVGVVDGNVLLDLDYREDSMASVDMNVVMDGHDRIIEIQGTGEETPFSLENHEKMLKLARRGIAEILSFYSSLKS